MCVASNLLTSQVIVSESGQMVGLAGVFQWGVLSNKRSQMGCPAGTDGFSPAAEHVRALALESLHLQALQADAEHEAGPQRRLEVLVVFHEDLLWQSLDEERNVQTWKRGKEEAFNASSARNQADLSTAYM